jgi:two-component system response regulator AtoC
MARILLVDDEPGVLFALGEVVESFGHQTVSVPSGEAALASLDGVDAVLTDFGMPGMNGLQLLEAIRARDSTLPVVLVTAQGSEKLAVRAMKEGAYDYLTKPYDVDEVGYSVQRAVETRHLRVRARQLALEDSLGVRIVGQSPALARVLEATARVADKDVTVLIRGETGTGKELFATLLHKKSRRADGR